MFNYNAFTPPSQNFSPVRAPSSKPLQNVSPAYFPPGQANWNPTNYFTPTQQPAQSNSASQVSHNVPYGVRVLLDDDDPVSSASSDSEETDTMPEVSSKIATSAVKEWDFGQHQDSRRKSETFLSNSPGVVKALNNSNNSAVSNQNKNWSPYPLGKVSTKPIYFSPLNLNDHMQSDKRAYFVTLEGFNISNSQRFFKIERLCHSLQAKGPYNEMANSRPFLHIGLWGDNQGPQDGSENIFEPWIYAIPYLQFRLVVTVNMSHAYEDPYTFEFLVDTRYLAIPTTDRRTQSLEVLYTEPGSNGSPGNTATVHLQITNEKLAIPNGFKNFQENQNTKQDMPPNYSIIIRQIFIGVPLCRPENPYSASPLITQGMQRQPDPYGKRGSAISLGSQERRSSILENCPQSPMSWSNFTPDMSPAQKRVREKQNIPNNNKEDPEMPPGIPTNNPGAFETANYTNGPSLFKFKGQPRFSIQPIKRDGEEANAKRTNRIQSSDFSALLGEDKSPLKILEAYVNAVKNGNRRQSYLSENSSAIGRFQPGSLAGTDNDPQTQSTSTLNASSFGEIVLDPAHLEEDLLKNGNNEVIEEFRAEDFVGKMAELVKTYQGSKILQKHISTADKEDLDLVVRELGEKIGELLLDPYANYIIQTLMQNGSPNQRLYLLQKMALCFIPIARDKKGTHALQAIVAQINSPEEFALIKHIVGNSIFELSMDPRANYVIQKLINVIPIDSSQFIYQPLFDNFIQVANNSFGLLVLKQMMGRVEQKEVLKQRVVELTCINFEKLIQNPYGNYAIQHIMEFYPKESLLIMNKILLKIIPYSSQKISSNVIEKCLTVCDAQFRKRVVEEILKNGRLSDLLKNKYGNFVTLQLLATTSTSDKKKLMQEILRCANSFNGTKYKMRWLKFVQENPLKINWTQEEQDNTNEISEVKESREEEEHSEDKSLEEEQACQSQSDTAENLEAVKRIWRDMTKEEKSETPTFQYNNKSGGKKSFSKREDGF